jgi:hypothetical protein
MVDHKCPYCAKVFPVHWTECSAVYYFRGAPQNYSGPEVFCPHCRKLARFTGATLARMFMVQLGAVLAPIAVVIYSGHEETPLVMPAAAVLGLFLGWVASSIVCCRLGELAAYSEQPTL